MNWFNTVGNPSNSGGGTAVGGQVTNPVPFDDNALNSVNSYSSYFTRMRVAQGILGTDGTLQGLRNFIVSDQENYQSTNDPIMTNGILPCNSGLFENSTPGNTQTSYSPIFLASPCRWPGAAPLGQLSPSHADFNSSSPTLGTKFTVTNLGQTTSQLTINGIQIESIDANTGTNYTSNFQVSGGSCAVGTVLAFQQSCTVYLLFFPTTSSNGLYNNVRLRIYTNADTIAVPLTAPLFGYTGLAAPKTCTALGYPGCDANDQTTFTLCAPEGGTCTFTGDRNLAFGANGNYNTLTIINSTACNTATFGPPDPAPNVAKACYISPPIGYVSAKQGHGYGSVYCADEGGTCSYEGNAYAVVAGGGQFSIQPAYLNQNFMCDVKNFPMTQRTVNIRRVSMKPSKAMESDTPVPVGISFARAARAAHANSRAWEESRTARLLSLGHRCSTMEYSTEE